MDAHTSGVIAAAVRGAGATFLEAPVSGSKGPAEQGKLIFLTAGKWRCGTPGFSLGLKAAGCKVWIGRFGEKGLE